MCFLALSIYVTLACGLLSVANAGFMAIGAYSAVLLTLHTVTPLPLALIVGAIAAAMVALLIAVPTLRLSGVYLAMATLAFGEVVRILILNAEDVTGGALGLNGIPQLVGLFEVITSVTVALYVFLRLAHSALVGPLRRSRRTKSPPS
jgi:branched-chain amino acid transport system permease protein